MRIIAGERKGRRLTPPPRTLPMRPTEERIKEAIFSMLHPIRVGAECLDGFAATGQIGLEFLSRGAGHCTFCEAARPMFSILKENVCHVGYSDRATLWSGDLRPRLKKTTQTYDYIYLDPPFGMDMLKPFVDQIVARKLLKEKGYLIVEQDQKDPIYESEDLVLEREHAYGRVLIRLYRWREKDENHLSGKL